MKLSDVILRDTRANQPGAASVPIGTLYYVTDETTLERSTGSAWESCEGGGVSDHGGLTGLADDDHTQYPLVTDFEADRGTIQTNWTDLTDGGATTLHSHAAASEANDIAHVNPQHAIWEVPGVGEGTIEVTIDGGGSAITTGIKGDIFVTKNIRLLWVNMLADQSGSIVVDIWNDTIGNYPPTDADSITASDPPTISTATNSHDNDITTWTTDIAAGSTLRFNVDSVTSITRLQLTIGYIRTDVDLES